MAWRAAVSRSERDQPQHVPNGVAVWKKLNARKISVPAAGLRHSRVPVPSNNRAGVVISVGRASPRALFGPTTLTGQGRQQTAAPAKSTIQTNLRRERG